MTPCSITLADPAQNNERFDWLTPRNPAKTPQHNTAIKAAHLHHTLSNSLVVPGSQELRLNSGPQCQCLDELAALTPGIANKYIFNLLGSTKETSLPIKLSQNVTTELNHLDNKMKTILLDLIEYMTLALYFPYLPNNL